MTQADHNSISEPDDERRRAPRNDEARRAHHDLIFTFARASEQHDADAEGHLIRIRHLVEQIALEMGFDADDAEDLGYDAMLHDVGKLHIPASILNKHGELIDDEQRIVRNHTVIGERMLSDRPGTLRAARIARHHHEAWDGSGYPDGLRCEEIPLEARLTTAADMLDALIASRSYKPGWSYEQALAEVRQLAGVKLDPNVVNALERCDRGGVLRAICEGKAPDA